MSLGILTHTKPSFDLGMVKTITLIGQVGMGKSFLTEKLTGSTGISKDSFEAVTQCAMKYTCRGGMLHMYDTPGLNPEKDKKLDHNLSIAQAFNSDPQHAVMMVVEAHARAANCREAIEKLLDRFENLKAPLGVVLTKMDTVNWTPAERAIFVKALEDECGLSIVCFSETSTNGPALEREIHDKLPARPTEIKIDADNFLHHFTINDGHRRTLNVVRREVTLFEDKMRKFKELLAGWKREEQKDLVFEFHAFCLEEIVQIQVRVSAELEFSFLDDAADNEVGHIASMTNQLKTSMRDLREMMQRYQVDKGVDVLRRCPHCGTIWAKVSGCDGMTTCGSKAAAADVVSGTMAHFTFHWNESGGWDISRSSVETVKKANSGGFGAGCGKPVTWSEMPIVPVPKCLSEVPTDMLTTVDIKNIQPQQQRS